MEVGSAALVGLVVVNSKELQIVRQRSLEGHLGGKEKQKFLESDSTPAKPHGR